MAVAPEMTPCAVADLDGCAGAGVRQRALDKVKVLNPLQRGGRQSGRGENV